MLWKNAVFGASLTKFCLFSLGVMNYPRKGKKKSAREERTAVCVLCRKSEGEDQYFIVQRPQKGMF